MATDQLAGNDIVKHWASVQRAFEDDLFFSNMANVFTIPKVDQTRQLDFVPLPVRVTSGTALNGASRTANTTENTNELQVPIVMNQQLHSSFTMTATDLNDPLRLKKATQACAEDIMTQLNIAVLDEIRKYSCNYVTISGAAGDAADVAKLEALCNSIGLPRDRTLALNPTDYAGLSNNLDVASRSFGNAISDSALKEGRVPGMYKEFMLYKTDYTAAVDGNTATGLTIDTTGANARFVPKVEDANGIYADNRTQTLTVSTATASGLNVGDLFEIAGVYAIHRRARRKTSKLQSFKVVDKTSTTLVVSPPLISGKDGSVISTAYQNVFLEGTGSSTAAIRILNNSDTEDNVGWVKDAVAVTPGVNTYMPGENFLSGGFVVKDAKNAGAKSRFNMYMTYQKQNGRHNTYIYDVYLPFGVSVIQPEMTMGILWNQS